MAESNSGMALNSARINYITHMIFPARTLLKDIAYWVTEIVAGLIFLLFLIRIDLQEKNLYTIQDKVAGYSYKYTPSSSIISNPRNYAFLEGENSGIPLDFNTHLLNNEYGWICLCYAVKHLVYIIDSAMLMKKKFCMPVDLVAPILNCGLWILWMLYGFLNSDYEIYAGIYERSYKDEYNWKKDNPMNNGNGQGSTMPLAEYEDKMNKITEFYNKNEKWTWLWVPTIFVCFVNLLLWIWGLVRKRSSAFTNVALSTILIPLQLFFLHLFLKGTWIASNSGYYLDMLNNNKIPDKDKSSKDDYLSFMWNYDNYEARWVFWVIYLSSWVGLIFAVFCVIKAIADIKNSVFSLVKNVLYALFFIAGFIWCLAIDGLLWQMWVRMPIYSLLLIVHIVCLVLALFIGIISILQRLKWKDGYYTFHNEYDNWKTDSKYNH